MKFISWNVNGLRACVQMPLQELVCACIFGEINKFGR